MLQMNDLQIFNTTAEYKDFLDDKIPERRFRLVYANKEVFFLTQEERNYFLQKVNANERYIQIGEYTFTNSFIALYPIKPNIYKTEYEEVIVDGEVKYREK